MLCGTTRIEGNRVKLLMMFSEIPLPMYSMSGSEPAVRKGRTAKESIEDEFLLKYTMMHAATIKTIRTDSARSLYCFNCRKKCSPLNARGKDRSSVRGGPDPPA